MKIKIIDVPSELQPESQKIRFPKHNDDFGIEQDFFEFIRVQGDALIVNESSEADCCYLPIFWTRWMLDHDYGAFGLAELQEQVTSLVDSPEKTFTICQYADGPQIDMGYINVFLASRRSESGLDVPLLCRPHNAVSSRKKKYLASFRGRLSTHPIRGELFEYFSRRTDVKISSTELPTFLYKREIEQSFIAICPRGHGGNSFRFYEAMNLGVVPMLLGDIDCRPFKKNLDWSRFSFYFPTLEEADSAIQNTDKEVLVAMGKLAQEIYQKKLSYSNWCNLLISELRTLYG